MSIRALPFLPWTTLPALAVAVLAIASTPPTLPAQEVVFAADTHSGRVLIDQGGSQRRPVDGFACVATALVALDWAQRVSMDMGAGATVPVAAVAGPFANPMGLQPGDRIGFRDLIYSVLLGADDAACMTLAANVGQDLLNRRQRGGDPVREFVAEMNNLAIMIGATSTSFRSPHGGSLTGRGQGGRTNARDLGRLALYAMSRPSFRFYSMQAQRAVAVNRGGQTFRFLVRNYNPYAGRDSVDGVKCFTRGLGGPGTILTSKRSHEVAPLPDGRTMVYPRRVVAVAFGPNAPALARQTLASGWQEFDRWTSIGRPYDRRLSILPPKRL